MKIADLAKELGYAEKDLLAKAEEKGVSLKNARAALDEATVKAVRAAVPAKPTKSDGGKGKKEKKAPTMGITRKKPPAKKEVKPKAAPPKKVEPPPAPVAAPVPPPKPEIVAPPVVERRKTPSPIKVEPPPAPPPKPHPTPPIPHQPSHMKHIEVEKPATPLIDVEKIVGQEKDIRILTPHKIDQFSRQMEEERERAKIAKATEKGHPGRDLPKPMLGKPRYRKTWPTHGATPVRPPPSDRPAEITVPIAVKDFSQLIGIKANLILKKLIDQGMMVTINSLVDGDTAKLLADEFKRPVNIRREKTAEENVLSREKPDDEKDRVRRAPVVTFMGHVDHGKTSLLDRIRKANVAAQESGGITQHIGAYKVTGADGRHVVFLDTPGHEAFTAMRARGANATDIAVIVVAADDGVMPQTEEAINHARAADVAIVVAINKCDKKEANLNRVKHQLAQLGLASEDWGGKTVCVEVSAISGQNIELLIEMLALEAEMLELRANPGKPAKGLVLEARKTEKKGIVATALVQDGTLKKGDVVLCGRTYGRVRHMADEFGRNIESALPSTPLQLFGLTDMPDAGDHFVVVDSLQDAKQVAEERMSSARERQLVERSHVTLDNLFTHIESGAIKDVRIILKADVKGSIEVLRDSLAKIHSPEVKLSIIHGGVGSISESDVLLADASNAIIIGFHVIVEERARALAKDRGVDIRTYSIIYQVIDEVKSALEGLLEPEKVEEVIGHCTIKEVLKISRSGTVAGCLVTDGKIVRSAAVRLVRDGAVIHEGKMESLRRFKDDVKDVANGFECGLRIAGYDDIKAGDIIEAYLVKEVARKLVSGPAAS
ncbi:MAG: hypothetical protein A2Z34_00505 [Planctomycetes bacterium RBG_16_59_8]|nr:MAG: hypothetical protein A2Z34_00505 [Planctomycetes bacterium RBG_16_59_8]